MQGIFDQWGGSLVRWTGVIGLTFWCAVAGAMPAVAEAGLRPVYHGRCDMPRAGWNEEVLRAREAAERECKENAVLRAGDRGAVVSMDAQSYFWHLKEQHDSLVRRAR
jgi:hypothetical protein